MTFLVMRKNRERRKKNQEKNKEISLYNHHINLSVTAPRVGEQITRHGHAHIPTSPGPVNWTLSSEGEVLRVGPDPTGLEPLSECFLSPLAPSGLSCSTWDPHCVTRDLHRGSRALSLWPTVSAATVHGLSCSLTCWILVPQPGMEPMYPALQGEFLTTGPPGNPWTGVLLTSRETQEEDAHATTGAETAGMPGTWGPRIIGTEAGGCQKDPPTGGSGSLDLPTP